MPLGQRRPTRRSPAEPTAGLSSQLQTAVPNCAQSCVSSYISQDFSCQDNDLSCLCSNYNAGGYTLGELALICVYYKCPNHTGEQTTQAYRVCDAEPAAVTATHDPISTVPPTTPSTTASNVQTSTSAVETTSPSGSSIFSSGTSITNSPTATGSTVPTSTSAGSAGLTTEQTVGISIAAVGAVILAIGALWIFACLRRRKAGKPKGERHSYDFIDEAPPRFSPFKHGPAEMTYERRPLGAFTMPRVQAPPEKRMTEWPNQNGDVNHNQHGNGHYSEFEKANQYAQMSTSPESRRSESSMRTTSQLLPDKPTTIPLRPASKSLATVLTPATVFEEERSPRVPSGMPPVLYTHRGISRSEQPQYVAYTKPAETTVQPPLSLDIPRHAPRSNAIQDLGIFPLPPPPTLKQPETEDRLSDRSQAYSSNNSVLNYYASPEIDSPDLYNTTPIEDDTQVRRPPPAAIKVTKAVYPPRAVRASAASDYSNRTSFESIGSDEPTPPEEEEKRLTPVAESPIAGIRYPKIPRSSNQAVPRSPPSQASPRQADITHRTQIMAIPINPDQSIARGHTPTLSGSTLAAKRRGDNLANNLERGLHISRSNHSQANSPTSQRRESPLKGYGRSTNPRKEPEWPLVIDLAKAEMKTHPGIKSPIWEPKLTPRREGDDLYLDLSLATPRHAHFSRPWS